MYKLIYALVVAATLSFGSAAMSAEPWYVSGSLGGFFRQGYSYGVGNLGASETRTFEPGGLADMAVGYRLLPRLRVEAELGYIGYDGRSLTVHTANPADADINGVPLHRQAGDNFSRVTGAVNAIYDFAPIAHLFTPYIGVGAGAAGGRRTSGFYASASHFDISSASYNATEGLAQAEGGLTFALPGHWSLSPAYRYVHFIGPNADVAHVAKVSLRYSF